MPDIYLTINLYIMKSTIKIEFDFKSKEPVISIRKIPTEDLRDQMICEFIHNLRGRSNICIVELGEQILSEGELVDYITIRPIGGDSLIKVKINNEEDNGRSVLCQPLIQDIVKAIEI